MAAEMQAEELEVLRSIYEGDAAFIEVNEKKFQYKIGDDGDNKSFLVEVKWTENYPDQLPDINLDAFYNKHILAAVKQHVVQQVEEQARDMLGMSMTFTLFEWVKGEAAQLMEQQVEVEVATEEVADEMEELTVSQDAGGGQRREKKEQLTKSQKRRVWDRVQGGGAAERARGWDWYDIVRHLSQTADRS